ncbi:MAG: protein phosphatase 2C domain-containing protein [Candidatus Poribacteria bacterium]|nr:protein phosphatase 2C domain-containing protein [Candidatus Poribacteria bacterium]
MVKLKSNKFITHKKGGTLTDCQDAIELNEDISRYAVADGATRSFYPKIWAELLVKGFCEETTLSLESLEEKEGWKEWINPLRQKWLKQVTLRVQKTKRFIHIDRLSKLESAASTFIGLEIDKTEAEWKAMIIGDSCLFHIGESGLKESYLIKKSEDFTNRPGIFTSFEKDNSDEPIFVAGQTNHGDIFILATDALSKWIIQHKEIGELGDALKQLLCIDCWEQFNDFVEKAREAENIRLANDDVAFMLISVEFERQLPKFESSDQELERQQNPWFVLLICLLAGGGMFVGLYLIFYFLLKPD